MSEPQEVPLRRSGSSVWLLLLLGPVVGEIALLLVTGAAPLTPALILSGLAPAYLLGVVPALATATWDRREAVRGGSAGWRLASGTVIGGLSPLVIVAPLYASGLVHGPLPLSVCLAGAAAALLCLALHLAWPHRRLSN